MSYTESMNLTLVLNGIGFVSRLAPGVLARYIGTMNTFIVHVLASAILLPVLSKDLADIGLRIGVISGAVGIGALLGSPVSGAIISAGNGTYTGAQAFSGTVMAAGGLLTMWIREVRRRKEQKPFKAVM
ncbi:hypothetical protein NW762_011076 [Fusarium torreyae]|uniref:Major facilitator superfamily (MFS) profile domain-containing protein n=1 Tax=Fusarium torreyae TaxID=1237075 RepID=A0A9W8RUL6_9HYPO|nr:hypothetical protein NW762_011076 [Fusarium torreyae]